MTAEDAAALAALRAFVASVVRDELDARQPRRDAPDRLLDIREAAAMLSLGRTATYQLIARGELRSIKATKRRRLVPASAIGDYIRERSGER